MARFRRIGSLRNRDILTDSCAAGHFMARDVRRYDGISRSLLTSRSMAFDVVNPIFASSESNFRMGPLRSSHYSRRRYFISRSCFSDSCLPPRDCVFSAWRIPIALGDFAVDVLRIGFSLFGTCRYGASLDSYRPQVPRLTHDQFFGPHAIHCDARAISTAGN